MGIFMKSLNGVASMAARALGARAVAEILGASTTRPRVELRRNPDAVWPIEIIGAGMQFMKAECRTPMLRQELN